MFQTAGYPVHPPYFSNFDYRSPPRTPPQAGGQTYYSPRHYSAPQAKGHARRATGDGTYTFTSTYSTPQKTAYYTSPEYTSQQYYSSARSTPQRKSDYVSASARPRESPRSYRVPADGDGKKQRKYSTSKRYSTSTQYVYHDDYPSDRSYEYLPRYEQYEPQPPPYQRRQSYHVPRADRRYRDQVPVYTPAEPAAKPRARRASYAAKPTQPTTPRRPSTATKPKSPPKATEEDARRAGVPAGYSYKNWDPTEEPILLLGSVFDANSLGKWIYDWTVFYYGAATPMTEVAGELWLLLIQLAGKVKRAEEVMGRIRRSKDRDLVDDFLEAGERLWQRFNKLLKTCESYMWKAAKKESSSSRRSSRVTMGQNSGCEFVGSIFGRDRELEVTEKLMTNMRLWSWRFDQNLDAILRNPAA